MERTKYTPKRLLSLLLALIMLLGMFPTAVFAAEAMLPQAGGLTVQSGDNGWYLEVTADVPAEGNYFQGMEVDVPIHYTFYTYDTRLFSVESLKINVWAVSDEEPTEPQVNLSNLTPSAEESTGVTVNGEEKTAYQSGVVIASGDFTVKGTVNKDGEICLKARRSYHTKGVRVDNTLYEAKSTDYSGEEVSDLTVSYLPLGYQIRYESSLSGAKGIPTGTYYSTYIDDEEFADGEFYDEEYFKVEADAPTLDGYEFLGWAINGEDDSENYVQQGAEFAPWQNTTLTAMWEKVEETQTHTVSFAADVTGVSQMPEAIIVPEGKKVSEVTNPNDLVKPIREGYNFLHWTDDLTTKAVYNFAQKITADVKLYPVWTRNQVKITWPTSTPAGVTLAHPAPDVAGGFVTSVDVGSEVTFQITLGDRYEIGTVKAGDRVLGSTVNGNIYTYTFTADKDLKVAVGDPTVKKFTISLPQGDGYEATFTDCTKFGFLGLGPALTEAEGATSYTFEYGDTLRSSWRRMPTRRPRCASTAKRSSRSTAIARRRRRPQKRTRSTRCTTSPSARSARSRAWSHSL